MRLLMINLLASALVLFSVSSASAFGVSAIAQGPTDGLAPGDSVTYDLYLDLDGTVGLVLLGASFVYDAAAATYDNSAPNAVDTYILYTGGKGASFLEPESDPWAEWPAPAPGTGQANVVWIANAFNPLAIVSGTHLMGTITMIVQETTVFSFNFDGGGTTFGDTNGAGGTNEREGETVNFITNGGLVTVPEPTTALLVGLGMVGLGVAGRRRA